jgi:uncharacterized membrane protein
VPLFEHWDGTTWSQTQTLASDSFIYGLSATATNDVWAVGSIALDGTFAEHFDGSKWSIVHTPNAGAGFNVLFGAAAISPNDAWAVGFSTQDPNSTRPALTLTEHWDGTSWSIIPSPNVGPNSEFQSNQLYGVTAIASNDVWAFGSFFAEDGSGQQSTLVLHWDGTSWTIVPSPNAGTGNFQVDILFGGTVINQHDLWMVGSQQQTGHSGTLVITAPGQ